MAFVESLDHGARRVQRFPGRAQALRHATQRVALLNMGFGDESAAAKQSQDMRRHCDLARMALALVHPGPVRLRRRLQRFDGQRHRAEQSVQHAPCVHPEKRGEGGHPGSAVDQRQTFLGSEPDAGETGGAQGFIGRHAAALVVDLAHAEQRARDVGGRHQVAARAHRSITRDHRDHAAIQQLLQRGDQFPAHCGRSSGKRGQTQQHGRPHDILRQGSAGAAGKVIHQVVLEAFGLFGVQREFDIAAHAGVDAVNAVARGQALLQFHAALPDTGARRLGEFDARLAAGDIFHIFDRDRANAQNKAVWHDYYSTAGPIIRL